MLTVNFLPWREIARLQKQKAEKLRIVLAVIVIIALLSIWHLQLKHTINNQENINTYLKVKQKHLIKQYSELQKIQNSNEKIISFIDTATNIKKKQLQNEKLLEEISKLTPVTVVLNALIKDDNALIIIGIAKSIQDIAEIMHNISISKIFNSPKLKEIKNDNNEHSFKIETEIYSNAYHSNIS